MVNQKLILLHLPAHTTYRTIDIPTSSYPRHTVSCMVRRIASTCLSSISPRQRIYLKAKRTNHDAILTTTPTGGEHPCLPKPIAAS